MRFLPETAVQFVAPSEHKRDKTRTNNKDDDRAASQAESRDLQRCATEPYIYPSPILIGLFIQSLHWVGRKPERGGGIDTRRIGTERRILCDRTLPSCGQRLSSGHRCKGYVIRLSWPRQGDARRAVVARRQKRPEGAVTAH